MKCAVCKGNVTLRRVVEAYDSNLPGVVVDGIERGTCAACGAAYRAVPRLRELHRLVLNSVLSKPWRLAPSEVRWLRLSMNLKAEELGQKFNVTPTHISRWETGAAVISALADRLLRMVAASFHHVDPPHLEDIDGDRSDALALRVTLTEEGWRAQESKPPKRQVRGKEVVRESPYKSPTRTKTRAQQMSPAKGESGHEARLSGGERHPELRSPPSELRKSAQLTKRGKIA